MPPIRVLQLSGTPYAMGCQHGKAYAQDIHQITVERVHLCSDETWTGHKLSVAEVRALAEACLEEHYQYAPELMQEVEGMAAATGLSMAELVIANGFTDFIDVIYAAGQRRSEPTRIANECTAVLVGGESALGGQAMLGQTWDMHATATPYVLIIEGRPAHAPDFLTFTITGCVGMIGMNEAGIAIGINNLAGADGQPGVTWPFVCRKVLMQTDIEEALACITQAKLAGGHNYLLLDREGRGYNIEAMSTATHVTALNGDILAHANQCLHEITQSVEREPVHNAVEDSATRVCRAQQFLQQRPVTPEQLMALTQDRSDGDFSVCSMATPPYYSESCGAVIMRPATHEFWGVWGLPLENAYQRFVI